MERQQKHRPPRPSRKKHAAAQQPYTHLPIISESNQPRKNAAPEYVEGVATHIFHFVYIAMLQTCGREHVHEAVELTSRSTSAASTTKLRLAIVCCSTVEVTTDRFLFFCRAQHNVGLNILNSSCVDLLFTSENASLGRAQGESWSSSWIRQKTSPQHP